MTLRDEMITVFGASGFIGRYVVRALAKAGYRVRAATRRPHLANELRPMGVVGQIQLVQANLRDPDSIARAVDGADGVINLVGILYEDGRQSFDSLQARGAGAIAEAAKAAGITRMVQISAIGADAGSDSKYARTKALGEQAVRAAVPEAVILRPSIVFGTEDEFFNKFADMARFAPALPLIGGGKTKFQPVWSADVAAAAVAALESAEARGRTYELGGPNVYTFKELMEFILTTIRRKRLLIPVPFLAAGGLGLLGTVMGMIAAFQALQAAGGRADPAALAGGIWEALLTTAAGMAVAIPATLALTWFEAVTDRLQLRMEGAATRLFAATGGAGQ